MHFLVIRNSEPLDHSPAFDIAIDVLLTKSVRPLSERVVCSTFARAADR